VRLVASGNEFKQISTILKNDGLIHSLHLMDTTEVIVNENVSSDPLVVTINRLQKLMKNLGQWKWKCTKKLTKVYFITSK